MGMREDLGIDKSTCKDCTFFENACSISHEEEENYKPDSKACPAFVSKKEMGE